MYDDMTHKVICFMVPTYNSGIELSSTISSIIDTGIDTSDYRILISDNNSSDNSIDLLHSKNNNADIVIHKNKKNVGRIQNWNNCLQLARSINCKYGIFVFTSDNLIPNSILNKIIEQIKDVNYSVIFTPYEMNYGYTKKIVRQLTLSERVVNSRKFIELFVSRGRFPFAPLQANIFNLEQSEFYFNEEYPLVADQMMVIEYLNGTMKDVLIVNKPFFSWNNDKNRTHNKIEYSKLVKDEVDLFNRVTSKYKINFSADFVKSYMYIRHMKHVFIFGKRSLSEIWRVHSIIISMDGKIRLSCFLDFFRNDEDSIIDSQL
jgi:hypothetical protein